MDFVLIGYFYCDCLLALRETVSDYEWLPTWQKSSHELHLNLDLMMKRNRSMGSSMVQVKQS